jgi:antitoxin HicB
MTKVAHHPVGSSFESFLAEEGILEVVDEAAVKEVIAWQVAEAMQDRKMTKSAMADAMQTSRAQVNRLLDPTNTGVALHTLYRAASVLGKRLKIEMVDEDAAVERPRRRARKAA